MLPARAIGIISCLYSRGRYSSTRENRDCSGVIILCLYKQEIHPFSLFLKVIIIIIIIIIIYLYCICPESTPLGKCRPLNLGNHYIIPLLSLSLVTAVEAWQCKHLLYDIISAECLSSHTC